MSTSVTVRAGTDIRFTSYRVRIPGYQDRQGNPEERQIALVFRKGESVALQRAAIEAAVKQYIKDHPTVQPTTPKVSSTILNITEVPE